VKYLLYHKNYYKSLNNLLALILVQMIKTDTEHVDGPGASSEIVVCNAEGNSLGQKDQRSELKSNQGMPSLAKKKPGRPKGSKNIPANGYQKSSSGQKVLVEKEMGYRFVILCRMTA
jgi:hypothetical protein